MDISQFSQMLEFSEAYAWADQYSATPEEYRKEFGLIVENLGSAVVLAMPENEDIFFNRVIGLGLQEPAEEQMVDDLLSFLSWANVRRCMINLSPYSQPAELFTWLEERGFQRDMNHAKLLRQNSPIEGTSSELRIELTGEDYADAFAYVAMHAFGSPDYIYPWLKATVGRQNWYHYVAWDGDWPVASGALFVHGEVGWLGHGSTLPSHRGWGAQRHLINRRIRDGIALGCKWFVSETNEWISGVPNPSYNNLLRVGFKQAYLRQTYIYYNNYE
jgi:hypothetical protein